MARGKKTPGTGHNSKAPLSDDDLAALQHFYSRQIAEAEAAAAIKKAEYAAANKAVNGLFSQARGELGYTRIEFEEVLAAEKLGEEEFRAKEAARQRRFSLHGLPVNTQLDMFARGDTADDEGLADADGFRAGKRGAEASPPDHIAAAQHQTWLSAWHRGQTATQEMFLRAQAVIAERAGKGSVELTPEPEAGPLEDDAKAAEAGWAKPSAGEQAITEQAAA